MWQRHWGLARDPFAVMDSLYVPLPPHDEALARLVYSIEQTHRQVIFRAEAGLGKTTVLRRAIAETRSPRRRLALVGAPSDGTQLPRLLAEGLGVPLGREFNPNDAWRALGRAIRVASLQGLHIVLAIDGWDERLDAIARPDLDALAHFRFDNETRFTVIRVLRARCDPRADPMEPWTLAIGLHRLTRFQAEDFLQAKLAAAGCTERIFTPRALTRIHALAGGVPRGLEQLAALSLMAGAVRGLEVIPPDVVDGVSQECWGSGSGVKAVF